MRRSRLGREDEEVVVGIKAFAVQYSSLILILLTFVIGASAGPAPSPEPKDEPLARLQPGDATHEGGSPRASTVGVMKLPRLFSEGRVEVDVEEALPLTKVLKSHDITATIRVGYLAKQIHFGTSRSVALTKHLLLSNVRFDAFSVIATEANEESTTVEFQVEQ